MFYNAVLFDQDLDTCWDMERVTSKNFMFEGATAYWNARISELLYSVVVPVAALACLALLLLVATKSGRSALSLLYDQSFGGEEAAMNAKTNKYLATAMLLLSVALPFLDLYTDISVTVSWLSSTTAYLHTLGIANLGVLAFCNAGPALYFFFAIDSKTKGAAEAYGLLLLGVCGLRLPYMALQTSKTFLLNGVTEADIKAPWEYTDGVASATSGISAIESLKLVELVSETAIQFTLQMYVLVYELLTQRAIPSYTLLFSVTTSAVLFSHGVASLFLAHETSKVVKYVCPHNTTPHNF